MPRSGPKKEKKRKKLLSQIYTYSCITKHLWPWIKPKGPFSFGSPLGQLQARLATQCFLADVISHGLDWLLGNRACERGGVGRAHQGPRDIARTGTYLVCKLQVLASSIAA